MSAGGGARGQYRSRRWTLYDNQYSERQNRFSQRDKYRDEVERLVGWVGLEAGMRVLDLGCDVGNAVRYLRDRYEVQATGLDFPGHLAGEWWGGGPFVRGDGHWLPFADASFDRAFLFHSLGHVLDPEKVMAEVRRVLRPRGRVAIVTPNRWFIWGMRPLNVTKIIPYKPDPTVLRYYAMGPLSDLLTASGFSVDRVETYGDVPPYLRALAGLELVAPFRERLMISATATP